MQVIDSRNCAPGMIVRVPAGLFHHVGIVSDRWSDGKPMIISNSRRRGGVAEEPWTVALGTGRVTVLGHQSHLEPYEVVERARARIGQPWDLFNFNCEHLVAYACGREEASAQLRVAVLLAGVVLAVSLISRG